MANRLSAIFTLCQSKAFLAMLFIPNRQKAQRELIGAYMGVFNRPRLELSTLLTLHWLELRKCPHKRAREIRNLYLWDQEVENKCIVEQLAISAQTTFLLIHIYVCTLPTGDIYFPQRRQSKVLFTYHR